jgi:hypothetical protein
MIIEKHLHIYERILKDFVTLQLAGPNDPIHLHLIIYIGKKKKIGMIGYVQKLCFLRADWMSESESPRPEAGSMDGWMDKWVDGWTNGRMDGWTDGRMDGWLDRWRDGWMDGLTDEQMNGRMDGQTNEQTDRQNFPMCVLQISSFRAAAQK